ncbi:MAG TPA: exosortase/archaeosortase family protein [Oligoflexia bacterium]|nr:exosortase/archaeosortase family protein [Oligoflexia bacterium]HMP47170.1 exosortase/archaeosortase family protein [Oligoflexia bacterium]
MNIISKKSTLFDYLLLASLLVLIISIFYPALSEIALICWENEDYSHGLLLPLISAYIWWDQREMISDRLKTAYSGNNTKEFKILTPIILLFSGSFLLLLGLSSQLSYLSWIAFFPVVISVFWLIFGTTASRIFFGPFLLMIMAKPLPDSVVVRIFWPLQVLGAKVGARTLEILQVPVYLSGNIIEIPGMRLMVEEACSGMRSVMALMTLSLVMIFFIPLNFMGKITLILFGLLLALALNIFRVALTGVLAHFYSPQAATGFFHTFSGLIVFIVGLPLIFFIASKLSQISFFNKSDLLQGREVN